MILRVSPTATTTADFHIQRFWVFSCPCWNPGFCGLSPSQWFFPAYRPTSVGPTGPPATSLAVHPLHSSCPSLPLLTVWMNVSLTPWLSNFHEVWISGSSGCFLFLSLLLLFFWLCKEVKRFLPMSPSWLVLLGCFLQIPGISVHEQILYFVLYNEYLYFNDSYIAIFTLKTVEHLVKINKPEMTIHILKRSSRRIQTTDLCCAFELGVKWFVDCHSVPVCIIPPEEGPCLFLTG